MLQHFRAVKLRVGGWSGGRGEELVVVGNGGGCNGRWGEGSCRVVLLWFMSFFFVVLSLLCSTQPTLTLSTTTRRQHDAFLFSSCDCGKGQIGHRVVVLNTTAHHITHSTHGEPQKNTTVIRKPSRWLSMVLGWIQPRFEWIQYVSDGSSRVRMSLEWFGHVFSIGLNFQNRC